MKQCFDFLYCSPEDSWWRRWPTGKYLNYLRQGRRQRILITICIKTTITSWKQSIESRWGRNWFHLWLVKRLLIGFHFYLLVHQSIMSAKGAKTTRLRFDDKMAKWLSETLSERSTGKKYFENFFNSSRMEKKRNNHFVFRSVQVQKL